MVFAIRDSMKKTPSMANYVLRVLRRLLSWAVERKLIQTNPAAKPKQLKVTPYIIRGRSPDQPLINLAKPWKRICERAQLADMRLHDLRHTAASVGVGQGMNLPVIGRLLGHTQASTTNRYAHVDIDPALAAADRISDVIVSAMEGSNAEPAVKPKRSVKK